MQLDHLIVPAADAGVAATRLAELLGLRHGPAAAGPFHAVYVSDGLTLDFDSWPEPVPALHFALRVSEAEFDVLVERLRAAGVGLRSRPHGPEDGAVGHYGGGRLVYWNEPAPHVWELLTVSYARAPAPD